MGEEHFEEGARTITEYETWRIKLRTEGII
jgi:hypothetical protein